MHYPASRRMRVIMRTQAFAAEADILCYAMGVFVYAIGVRDKKNHVWLRGIFIPKRS